MEVIRKLGDRVEKEHIQFLRDSQRIGEHSSTETNGSAGIKNVATNLNFESLVGGANSASVKADSTGAAKGWDDDVWDSIFTDNDGVRNNRLQEAIRNQPTHLLFLTGSFDPSSNYNNSTTDPNILFSFFPEIAAKSRSDCHS